MLITGGAGFIGSHLVRLALAETTAALVIVDKLTYAGSLKNIEDVLSDPRVTFSRTDITHEAAVAAYSDLITSVRDRPGHDRRYAIDATKIRTQLGWRPHYTFERGLAQTVRWYVDNRQWCESIGTGTYQRERLGLGAPPAFRTRVGNICINRGQSAQDIS